MSNLSPRTAAHLPGYTFVGHGFQFFGSIKAPVDLYSKRGGLTAEVTRWDKQQQAAHGDNVESFTLLRWRDHGASVVAVRVAS